MGRKPYRSQKQAITSAPIPEIPKAERPPLEEKYAHPIYSIKVMHPSLRHREAPSKDAKVVGLITDQGIYNVYEESCGWARLNDGSWVMLQFCKKLNK